MKLLCINPEHVAGVWPMVRPMIQRAFARTGLDGYERTEREVLEGLQLLWLAFDEAAIEAVLTTQLIKVGERKVCVLVACSGQDSERWLPLLNEIENFARAEGCSGVRIIGRKGWQRVLDGYSARHVILEKSLDG